MFQFNPGLIGESCFHAVVRWSEAWDIYQAHTSGNESAAVDIFTSACTSALKAHMHKPDEDSEYNKERTEAFTYAGGVRYVQRSDTVNKYMHD